MGYTTDLTDKQWELIAEYFEIKKGKHLQEHEKRELVNAVLYRVKTGCQWRMLPKDFTETLSRSFDDSAESGLTL